MGKQHSEERKEKIRQALLGRKFTKERCKNISLALTGRKLSEDHIKSLRGKTGELNGNWKGGQYKKDGYVFVIDIHHPDARLNGYIKRSRLVAEESTGIRLTKEQVVHHINGIKDDDRIENLMLFKNNAEHLKYHASLRAK